MTSKKIIKFSIFFSIALIAWFAFYQLDWYFYHQGFASESLIHYGEIKLRKLYHSSTTPNPILAAFTGNPFLITSFIGAVCLSWFMYTIITMHERGQMSRAVCTTIILYILISPSFIFLYSQAPYRSLLFLLFFIAGYTLRRYYWERSPSFLVLFGMTLVALTYIPISNYYILLVFLPAILAISHAQKRPVIAIFIIVLMPSLFFLSTGSTVNDIPDRLDCLTCPPNLPPTVFLENISTYTASMPNPNNFNFLTIKNNFMHSFLYLVNDMATYFLLLLPFWIFWIRINQYASVVTFVSMLVIPILFIWQRIYLDIPVNGVVHHLIFIVYSVLFFSQKFGLKFERHKNVTMVLIICYAISFSAAIYQSYFSTFDFERNFTRAILGQPYEKNLEDTQKIAALIENPGKVLMDDTLNYKLVFFTQNPKKFIMPGDTDFKLALADPEKVAEYVVVNKHVGFDVILKEYPETLSGELQGYRLVADLKDMVLFQKL